MTANLTLRQTKGAPLTIAEMDGNLTALKTEAESASAAAAAANAGLADLDAAKQDALIAGSNITIDPVTNVIAASSNSLSTVTSTGITDASATGRTILTGTASASRTALGLGTAATSNTTAFAAASHVTDTANPHGVTKAQIGLGSVDNTTDLAKPVSTATQTALDQKVNTSRTVNGKALTSDVTLGKSDIGLGNADNTSDANKPVSIATQAALDQKVSTSAIVNSFIGGTDVPLSAEMGKTLQSTKQGTLIAGANITIDPDGTISASSGTATVVAAGITDAGATGVSLIQSTTQAEGRAALALGSAAVASTTDFAAASHAIDTANPHAVTKAQVGLSNVDNTSDANKPVSTAQQAAIDLKVPLTRTINGNALSANVTLSKTDIGLANVDNTSDLNKPVSTAQQAALDSKVSTTGNAYGFNTPSIPTLDTAIAAGTTATQPICDWITTATSDGDGTGNTHQDWAGLQRGISCRMGDGTLFLAYIQNNAGTDRLRLMRSPTGGATNGGTWTQVATVSTTIYKSILLRDRSRDHLFWVTVEGTTTFSVKLRVFNSAGTQIGTTYTVQTAGTGFMKQITSSGFYVEAGVSPTGRVVLAGWQLPDDAATSVTTTLQCYKTYQWLFWDGADWTQEPWGKFYIGERADYDNVTVGINGDPDLVCGVAQGNVAMWEAVCEQYADRLSQARLPGFYSFHKFMVWWHNRRTGDHGYKWISPPVPWQVRPWDGSGGTYDAAKDIPEARTKQAMFNYLTGDWWIPYRYTQPKPYTPGFTFTGSISGNTLTASTVTGTPLSVGTTITAHSAATTGMLPTRIIGGTGTGGAGSYILDTPHSLASGTISACNGANPSAPQAPTSHIRVMIVSPKGEVKWDGKVLDLTYGQVALTMTSTGRVYMMFLALGLDNANTNCHMWELTRTATGDITPVTLALANSLNCTNSPTGNVGFGTNTAYLGGAITLPARASNQGPIFPDLHHGSKPVTNTLDVIISRRATDHNSSGTLTTSGDSTGHKMDVMRIRVPH